MKTKEKVEEWLKNAPKEINIEYPIAIEEQQENITTVGKLTPKIISKGYSGSISFKCKDWEK